MRDPAQQTQASGDGISRRNGFQEDWGQGFDDLAAFAKAVEAVSGRAFDFSAVIGLNTNFLQSSDEYMILNVKDANTENPDRLLFLTENKALLFSKRLTDVQMVRSFDGLLDKPFGPSTVLTFITLSKATESFKTWLEQIVEGTRKLEQDFDYDNYQDLSRKLERLDDFLEDLHDLLLKLEERSVKQVNTQSIALDYNILMEEIASLQGRCSRRLTLIRELAREHETQATKELNLRIERLSEIMKKLTAFTVILMVPTLVATHYGMNFAFMPEIRMEWAYPTVILVQLLAVVIGIITFKKIGWL